jgi:hypothetical protein
MELEGFYGFDLKAKEAESDRLTLFGQGRKMVYENKVLSANAELSFLLLSNSYVDTTKGRAIVVNCYKEEITIKFIYDVKSNNSCGGELSIRFPREYDVKYNDYYKKNVKKYNISEGDVTFIKFSGYGIDLLENGIQEMDELYEFTSLCMYVAKEFKEDGELFKKIRGIYAELNALTKEIDDIWSKRNALKSEIKAYLLALYEAEFRRDNYISDNNVIIIKSVAKGFATFTATKIVSKKVKYYSSVDYYADIKYLTIPKGKETPVKLEKYYIELNEKRGSDQNDINQFYRSLAIDKFGGDEILLYTLDEWNVYMEMMESESLNIRNMLDDKHYQAKSKFYEEMYYKR